ncbi:MAG: hypothetical protein C0P75_007505 [Bacilli bacterium]|uniref:Uncharacterized protein n=1 Tax=Ureibacillus suwonensis TaxID=313007 RepID=A0ABW0RED7_9BACL
MWLKVEAARFSPVRRIEQLTGSNHHGKMNTLFFAYFTAGGHLLKCPSFFMDITEQQQRSTGIFNRVFAT